MRQCDNVRCALLVAVVSLGATVSAVMAATIIDPDAGSIEVENTNYSADGLINNANSTGGIILIDGGIAGIATCNVMAMTWSGDYDTPSANGLTQVKWAIDLNDNNGQFTEGANESIYITN